MALTKYKIGDLITVVDERNNLGIRDFFGININKEFMPTVADIEGLDENKYKIVRKNRFVYSGMQTGRDNCIRISMYLEDKPILVSPAYTTFEITATDIVLPLYFFMLFLSKEKDRYGAFCSDGSIRSNLDWEVFCDIELELPPLAVQQKYVDVYNAMLANQKSYERGLDDLRLTCDGYIEALRRNSSRPIGNLISEINNKNTDESAKKEMGVSISKIFIPTKAKSSDISTQKKVAPKQFAFNTNTSRNSDTISIAINNSTEEYAVSNTYCTFECKAGLLPEYLYLWLRRNEFNRYARFNSWGSARETLSISEVQDYEIAVPSEDIQRDLINILKVYNERKSINEKLKAQIKNICPILIKGSIEEARKEA